MTTVCTGLYREPTPSWTVQAAMRRATICRETVMDVMRKTMMRRQIRTTKRQASPQTVEFVTIQHIYSGLKLFLTTNFLLVLENIPARAAPIAIYRATIENFRV
ncbi:MAG: hypothetical protein OEY18_09110 [Candidatus Aminicenantes bacterium]|nr:hypothetical protein [Candidatus Aminicenantes bacterium]MDH5742534.1 hypothetical protein [Candidatus Aminicenantes bacterium]